MKIEANDKEIQEILSLGYFKIPRFQRPYSWGEDEINTFWQDIIEEKYDQYFIGSMVVFQTKKPHFGIVDGQQRLTTITIILAAIRNAFVELEQLDLARGIHHFIERANINNKDEFVLNSETSYPYLQDCIQSFTKSNMTHNVRTEEKNLENGVNLINNSLLLELPHLNSKNSQPTLFSNPKEESIQRLKEIRDKILSLKLVFIQLDREEDAYLIFETLNARGQDLTTADLVKNLLLKVKTSYSSNLDTAKLMWNNIIKSFDDAGIQNGIDLFLYHYWLSTRGIITDKKLFNEVKKEIKTVEDADAFLYEMQTNSNYYLSMLSPSENYWSKEEKEVRDSLEAIVLFNVKQSSSMLLALIRSYRLKHISLKMLRMTLKKIESFHYAFNAITQQRSSGSIAGHFSKYAILLTNSVQHAEIQSILTLFIKGLERKFPTFNEFKTSFESILYTSHKTKNKKIIKYSLFKILGAESNGLSIDYGTMSLEHILPEDQLKSNYTESDIGSIGNLLLVDKKTNNEELGNLTFQEKILLLREKNYPLDEYLQSQDKWEAKQIQERSEFLLKSIYSKIDLSKK